MLLILVDIILNLIKIFFRINNIQQLMAVEIILCIFGAFSCINHLNYHSKKIL